MARKTRKMPSADGWVRSLASVARERRAGTTSGEVVAAAGDEEDDAKEEADGEREGVVCVGVGAW